jgi:hypothetical protein
MPKSKPAAPKRPSKTSSPRRKRLTYKELVKKICGNPKFACEVHGLVCIARGDNECAAQAAATTLNSLFEMTPEELKQCCLNERPRATTDCLKNGMGTRQTNPTTFMLLDFAAMV